MLLVASHIYRLLGSTGLNDVHKDHHHLDVSAYRSLRYIQCLLANFAACSLILLLLELSFVSVSASTCKYARLPDETLEPLGLQNDHI